jgi:hypothetical protein
MHRHPLIYGRREPRRRQPDSSETEPIKRRAVVEKANISAKNAAALVIGPPIMIKLTLPVLAKMGLTDADIYTSLESRMK